MSEWVEEKYSFWWLIAFVLFVTNKIIDGDKNPKEYIIFSSFLTISICLMFIIATLSGLIFIENKVAEHKQQINEERPVEVINVTIDNIEYKSYGAFLKEVTYTQVKLKDGGVMIFEEWDENIKENTSYFLYYKEYDEGDLTESNSINKYYELIKFEKVGG